MDAKVLYLCAGTQSSGSTLISWCFLQRPDMDGFLDQRGDILPHIPESFARPYAWCKFTVNCFRLAEARIHFEDEGWEVRPLLVIRDVRAVLNSLIKKSYGRNGVTAEEPPLRMRLRRFKEDWELFRQLGWPMIQYEKLIGAPQATLQDVCRQLALPWDTGMMEWTKAKSDISAPVHGNATFRQTVGKSLIETINPSLIELKTGNIPPEDLDWLEREFAEFNRAFGYPEHAPRTPWKGEQMRAIPRWENTRRHMKKQKKNPVLRVLRAITPKKKL
ncbi:MAG TPA: hypothetical protein VIL86_15785 [Tepidisphaeraceae bacterium]|jgi:hypothetical protein